MCVLENDDLVTNPTGVSNMPDPIPNSLFLTAVDTDEVINLIKTFDTGKATGPCSIPPKILHIICENIANPISKIANLSFLTGVHPECLKIAKVVLIFKSGSKMLTSNYQPISLLSNLNKILEKPMFARVLLFLEKENVIYNNQFGFRPKHSTNHAVISIIETIREDIDNDKFSCGVFVDLQHCKP